MCGMSYFRFESHSHTHYSNLRLLDCINKPKDLVDRAIELGLSGIAITDHETLAAHPELNIYQQELIKKYPDFKIALGNEIYLCANREKNQEYYHFILIAKNAAGHRALRELSSKAWLNSYSDRGMERVVTTYDDLEKIVQKFPSSLVACTACFLPGQKVRIREGEKNIEDITSNDYILNYKGEWEKVNFSTSRNYFGEGNVISFTKEPLPISCTSDHKFLVLKDNNLIWVEAKNLKKNDKCVESIPKIFYTNNKEIAVSEIEEIKKYREQTIGKQNYSINLFRMKDNIVLTNNIMRFFGLWLADGHISDHLEYNRHQIGFTFNNIEFDIYYNGFVKAALNDLGLKEEDYSIKRREEEHRVDLTINKVEFCIFMKSIFGVSHADNKYIPERLLHISRDFDIELFFGYMLGDGYFRYREKEKSGEVVAASISQKLIRDFCELGKSFDLSGSITISKARKDKNGTNHRQSYYLTYSNSILGKNLTKERNLSHEELISIIDRGIIKKPQFIDFVTVDGVKYQIKKVKVNKTITINEKVYCLNVQSHSFMLNNVIVHNCLGGEVSKTTLKLIQAERNGDESSRIAAHNHIIQFILWCKKLFGEDFYLECAPGCSKDQIEVNQRFLSIAHAFGLKMIVSTDAHYLRKEDRYVHKAYLNSKGGEREVDSFYEYAYLQSNEEIIENLAASNYDISFVEQMFKNSMEIYSKIENYSLLHSQQIPEVEISDYPKQKKETGYKELDRMFNSDDKVERNWINQCWNKLAEKDLLNKKEYLDELEEEAEVKKIVGDKLNTNMFRYPLLLQHYIDMFWECGSTVGVGRGSACAALNHYLLGISQLDPIQYEFPFFRYMNRDTDGLGDIDLDLAPSKRPLIIKNIKDERRKYLDVNLSEQEKQNLGCTMIATFGTESSKSAVLTACRGYRSDEFPDGIDVDTAQYLSSLIPSERGFVWPVRDVVSGNDEKGRKPISAFINEVNQYPGLLDIIQGIESLIKSRGIHASGVVMFENDPYEHCCFMRATSGEIVTQYDLHMDESCGLTKLDLLVTSVQDMLVQTLLMMQKDGILEQGLNLRELYNKYLHPDVLPLDDKDTWNTIQNASSLNLFQLDSTIGRQGAKKVRPKNMQELSNTNGLIRLMTEDGGEPPMEKYVRFKKNPELVHKEMKKYGLTAQEEKTLNRYVGKSYGIGISQEQLMRTLMDPDICNFSLKESNKSRKTIAKKKMEEIPILKENVFKKAKSAALANYVWDWIVSPSVGYSFSDIHSTSYSFIGFQTAYLATHWNPIYWNTACLIVDSGSLEESEGQTDYAKIAKALGKIISNGISISLVNINESDYSFKPDAANNRILYAMNALNKVGGDVIGNIIKNRQYKSLNDFLVKCPLNKTVMVSLIKSGAFDETDGAWAETVNPSAPRRAIMAYYISKICEPKKKLTLQNLSTLIQKNLIPDSLSLERQVFLFNKKLKNQKEGKEYYLLKEDDFLFYEEHFSEDDLIIVDGKNLLPQSKWDNIYSKMMNNIREWLKENQEEALNELNNLLFKECWDKYATGTVSAWEMESMCFYYHEHELAKVNTSKYGISDFNKLPTFPKAEKFFKKKGKEIPIYETTRIIGTVLGKNDVRSTVSILTTTGVVDVKFTKEYYANYNRQLSEVQLDGTKKVIDKSWFTRGTKIMVTGYRIDDTFRAKSYSHTSTHQLYRIKDVTNDGQDIILEHERG